MSDLDPGLDRWVTSLRDGPAVRPEARARLAAALRRDTALSAARRSAAIGFAAGVAIVVATGGLWLVTGDRHSPVHTAAIAGPAAVDGSASAQVPAQASAQAFAPAQFMLHERGARSVSVVGDFNDWDASATPLEDTGGGVWSVIVPLRPGPVRYAYLVNGSEWLADPQGVPAGHDFGRPTSIAFFSLAQSQ